MLQGASTRKIDWRILIAQQLFPPATESEVTWSLIRYGQLLSKQTQAARLLQHKHEAERLAVKQAPRVHMDKNAFSRIENSCSFRCGKGAKTYAGCPDTSDGV